MGQDISWVETAGGTSNDHGRAVQVDGAGNLYVLGYFSAPSAWFGSASLSTSGTGTYLTKYSNAGNFLWARKISDTNVADAYGLKTDAAGNSYVVTTFTGTTTLGTATLTSSGASDIVIAKYTTSGDVVWATKAGGSAVDKGISITTDAAGNSYITGSLSGTAVFGSTILSSAASTDGFVAKLNANGSFAWAQKMGGNSADEGVSVVIDASGTVYVAGNFSSSFSLAGANLAYSGNQDIFLVAYSNAGTAQWARSAGGSYADKVSSLTIDGAGNLYLGGHFNRSANFGSVSLASSGNSQDIFLAKYTNTGAGVWATSAGGTGLDELSILHADTDGNLYLTGSFSGRATIGGATLNSVGSLDIYAAHYASNGAAQWAIGAGSARDDRGLGIVSDAARNVYVTGYFQENTTNFGGIVIPNRGGEEIFISKLIPALVTTSVTAGPYCAGQAVIVNYKATRNFRYYSAQLSDETGSFASPVQIGTVTSNSTTGSIAATIPANTPAGSKYRIRVVASAANLAGTDNGTDLRINQVPAAPALTASSPGLGGTLFLTASDIPGATYSWTGPRGFTSNLQNPSRSGITDGDVGTYTATVNVNGCTNTASVTMALSTVPTFDVDLRGQPNGYWDSPSVKRSGSVCGDDNCIVFNVILDPGAAGLELELLSGAMPGGAMYYKLNCGTQAAVGEPICVDNSGIITISMCKPGNNANAFRIKSISPYDPQDDLSVTAGCSATLRAPLAFHEESIIWKDLTGGGEYLKYLDYTTGKREVTVSPDNNAPAYVDYEVTGTSMQSPCSSTPYADVIRVYFYPPPTIAIGPAPAIICPAGSGVALSGTVTGGDGDFNYIWTDPAGKVVSNQLSYTATAVGTYKLQVVPKNSSNCREFSATVAVVSNLSANAGPDQLVCSQRPVQLAGAITAATGGVWSGGGGTFSPSNTALDAVYTPTAAEIAAGSVKLTLTSTGNGSCAAVKDDVLLTFYPFDVELAGTPVICSGTLGTVTAKALGGSGTISYKWSSGETTATILDKSAGTYTVTINDSKSCAISKSFTISEVAGPTGFTASAQPETCGASNGSVTVSGVTNGTAPYKYSIDGTKYQSATTFSGLAAGNYTIYVQDANGCTVAKNITITNLAGPTAVAASTLATSCANNDGSITVGAVIGGAAPYTYAIDGTNFQNATSFAGLASGVYTLTAKDNNGCIITTTVTVNQNVPTNFASTTVASTCGASNASIHIGAGTGGTAPYTYSIDGTNFQASATLQNLSAGTHTVTVKDAKGCTFSKAVTVSNTAGPSAINLSGSNSTCGGANATIAVKGVTGGTAPYTYSLDGTTFQSGASFGSLLAGEYEVTVKDANGCVVSQSISLEDIAGPAMFTASATVSSCGRANGSITVGSVTGGTSPYTYSLDGANFQASNTLAGLLAGEHTITIKDANACVVSQKVILENVAGPTELELASIASTCGAANGSITINNVAGGTAPYTYSLDGSGFQSSPAFTGLLAGAYSITVKDANGCRFSAETTVENVAGPTNLTASTTSAACGTSNGAISITNVSGGIAPYTYSIDGTNFQASAAFTALAAGTHTTSVKDANGCIYVKAIEVTNQGGPSTIAATTQPASCQNNDGSISVGNITGGTAPYTYSINGTSFQSDNSFAALASGEYNITVKDANGCAATKTVQVGKQGPAGFASTTRGAACGAENGQISVVSVDGGAAPYAYSINEGSFQSSAVFTSLPAGTYSITIQDANGCTFADEVEVANIEGPADLTASVGKTTCGNSNGQIKVDAVIGGTAPYTYSLDGVSFQGATTFAGLAAGEYQVTVKDANGCTEAKAVTVANTSGPNGFTVAGKASTCGAANGEAMVSAVTGGTAPYTYSKDGANFQPENTLTGLSEGTHTITVKDAGGCTFTKQVVIESITGPTAYNLASVAATCGAANGAITVSDVTGGTAPYTYALNEGAFQTSAAFAEVTAGEHTITVKDANGCTLSQQVTVTGIAGPAAIAAAATPTACSADNGTITVRDVTGGTAPYTYSLDEKEYQAAASFSGLAAGVYDVSVKDANGCSTSTTVTVSLKGPKEAVLTAAAATCGEENGSITITSVNGGTKPFAYGIDGSDFQSAATFTNLAAGTYTVTVKDAEGCTLVMTQQVSGSGGAIFTATGTSASCGSSNGKVAVSNVSGGLSPHAYSINGTTFQSSPEFRGLAEGEYQVWVKDAAGCLSSKTVEISSTPPVSGVKAAVAAPSCGKAAGQLTISEVTGGTAPYTYSLDGTNFTSATTLEDVVPGTFTLTVKDASGCTYSTQVQMPESVSSAIDYVQHPNCFGTRTGEVALKATGANDQTQYSIDGGKTFQKSAVFKNLAAGTYQLITSFSATCSVNVGTVELKEPSELKVEVTPLTKAAGLEKSGSAAVTKISGGVGPFTYSLDGGSFSSDSVFTNLSSREYTLTMKDSRGCMATITFVIEGQGDIDIPNGFTPNGDGINDKWMLKNVAKLYPNCSVTVYNRWGSEVFASRGYTTPWDGTFKGKRLPDGTYYCIIELGDGTAPIKTSVTIMR